VSQSPYGDSGSGPSWEAFSQDAGRDVPPGPALAALTGEAVANLGQLDEGQLLGVGSAARRLQAYAGYLEIMAVAEFARRNDERLEASKARGDRVRSRDGEYPAEELGFEMNATAYSAAILIDMARNIITRLPGTLAGMAAGDIDRDRARAISNATAHLPDEKAAAADEVLAKAAPEMRVADLQEKAGRLESRLDPEGVQARKDAAKRDRRVELRRERSGAASLAGRELDPADALTGKASIDAEARRLRQAGLAGTLDQIRAMILLDRIHQRSSWDRLAEPDPDPDPGLGPDPEPGPGGTHGDGQFPDAGGDDGSDDDNDGGEDADEGHPGGRTPLPALISITVPVGTLLGWSQTPADVGTWGLMDAATVRDLIAAASRHPRTRWCYTLTGPSGEAIAHACARGSHPWPPPSRHHASPGQASRDGPGSPDGPADPASRQARLAELLADLNAVPEPVARGTCDHAHGEDRYIPSRKLKHLIRARTARCCAPGCGAQAITGEIDHTIPYPAGETCEHNLSPPCQRHHHAKHAPGWKLEQPEPGVMRWTTPSGRSYTTRPTQYDE
jgi:Domain of unknown function (DUF222)